MVFERQDLTNLKWDNRPYASPLSLNSANEPKIADNFVENDARYAPSGIFCFGLFMQSFPPPYSFVGLVSNANFFSSPSTPYPGSHSWRENLLQKYRQDAIFPAEIAIGRTIIIRQKISICSLMYLSRSLIKRLWTCNFS